MGLAESPGNGLGSFPDVLMPSRFDTVEES